MTNKIAHLSFNSNKIILHSFQSPLKSNDTSQIISQLLGLLNHTDLIHDPLGGLVAVQMVHLDLSDGEDSVTLLLESVFELSPPENLNIYVFVQVSYSQTGVAYLI